MICLLCGLPDHAGGCELTAFYQWQRFGRLAETLPPHPPLIDHPTPHPPGGLIDPNMGGCDEPPPLSQQSIISKPRLVNKESKRSRGLLAVDDPKMVAMRARMAYARSCKK